MLRPDFLWILFGRLVAAVIAVTSLRVMTSLLEPRDYGIYALLVAFQGFCGLILINPIGQYINRHTHAWWDDGILLRRLAEYNTYIVAVSVGIAVMVVFWWILYPSTDKSVVTGFLAALSVSVMVYIGTWNGTIIYILNMIGFRGESVGWMITSSVLGLAFSTMLTHQYHTAMSWAVGQALGMAVGAIGAGMKLRQYQAVKGFVVDNPNSELPALLNRQTILRYCLPLALATGFMWLQNTGYRFLVGSVWGATELGILVIGLSISAQLWSIVESFTMQFLNPYFFRHITDAKTDSQMSALLSDMVNIMWPLYAVFAGFNILFASTLLIVLTDDRYHAAVAFVMLGAVIEFARCTTNLWSYVSQIQQRTAKIVLPYGLGALVLWLSASGISYFGGDLKLLAIAMVISATTTCATMVVQMQSLLPVVLDIRRWLAGLVIFVISLVLVANMPIQNEDLYQSAAVLLLGVLFSGGCMAIFLWRNSALERLLSVSLRGT